MIIARESRKMFKANYREKNTKQTTKKFYGKKNWKYVELWGEKVGTLFLISPLFKNRILF